MKNVMTRINDFGNKYSGILAVVGLFIPVASHRVRSAMPQFAFLTAF